MSDDKTQPGKEQLCRTNKPRQRSAFLEPGRTTTQGALAIVQLSRDNFAPVYLQQSCGEVDGYAEGAMLNTRFGSFPHSTLLGVPWGAQIRASAVDTGSRGRKRKRQAKSSAAGAENDNNDNDDDNGGSTGAVIKKAVAATSGFVHVLAPTPELWTSSLPHRTQVVYTPDYSYILHRLCARPGSVILEAGAGSGSFSHAAARAVFSGYPRDSDDDDDDDDDDRDADGECHNVAGGDDTLEGDVGQINKCAGTKGRRRDHLRLPRGKVYSFELDKSRFIKMNEEIHDHGLQDIIHLEHRNVYHSGFLVGTTVADNDDNGINGAANGLANQSPEADCVFLDLPAPWEAIPHLSRRRPPPATASAARTGANEGDTQQQPWISPLNPHRSVHLCTFLPCIEQVTRTIDALRKYGWVEIDMVEVAHKKINVYRERVGVPESNSNSLRSSSMSAPTAGGVQHAPRDVKEAVARLRDVNARARAHHHKNRYRHRRNPQNNDNATEHQIDKVDAVDDMDEDVDDENDEDAPDVMDIDGPKEHVIVPKAGPEIGSSDNVLNRESMIPPWMQGHLVHRPETEIKTHTSYLTFAIMPQEWSDEQEQEALQAWPIGAESVKVIGSLDRETRKNEKRLLLQGKKSRGKRKGGPK